MQAEVILGLYVERGMTHSQIAAEIGISRQRVHQVIGAALQESAERTDGLAKFALDRELLLIEGLIREAAQILNTKCETCEGERTARAKCDTCEKTGYLYPPDTRLEAIDRIGRASERRIRLLRLDEERPAPDPGPPYYEFLQTLSDDDFAAEVEKLKAALAGADV